MHEFISSNKNLYTKYSLKLRIINVNWKQCGDVKLLFFDLLLILGEVPGEIKLEFDNELPFQISQI